jgi:hypothetical protein
MKTTVKQLATGILTALLFTVVTVNAEATKKVISSDSLEILMTTENNQTDGSTSNSNFENVQENEATLEIESWMTDAEAWNFEFGFMQETEAGLEIESWMTSGKAWNTNELNNESALTIESWMTDSTKWK